MLNFSTILEQRGLSHTSSFEDIAQAAIECHYLPPYPGKEEKRPTSINRKYHGGLHVSRSSLNAEMIVALYKKYAPDYVVGPTKQPLTEEDLKLLKLAIIYHDSANTSEVKGEEEEHAQKFLYDMQLLGYSQARLLPFAEAIAGKDAKPPKDFLQKVVHDADCLDIIRVCRDNFDPDYLDILQDLKDVPGFKTELSQIIRNHHDTIELMEGSGHEISTLHRECELARNCPQAVQTAMINMFLSHAVIEGARLGKRVDLAAIDPQKIYILDLFNRGNNQLIEELILSGKDMTESVDEEDEVLTSFKEEGFLVRALKGTEIDKELATLRTNAESLAKAGLETAEDLRQYLAAQSGQDLVFTPDGFRWRPCSYCTEGVPVRLFSGGIGVLINPGPESGAVFSHFYKRNVCSNTAAQGHFIYDLQTGSRKDKGSFEGIREKLLEQNRRRIGIEEDPNSHYYGKQSLKWSEVLGTYQPESVAGILINDYENIQSVKDALLLRAKLGGAPRKFYHYLKDGRLVPISERSLMSRLERSTLESIIEDLNEQLGIPLALSIESDLPDRMEFSEPFKENFYLKKYRIHISSGVSLEDYEIIKHVLTNISGTPFEEILDVDQPITAQLIETDTTKYFDLEFCYMDNKITPEESCEHEKTLRKILSDISASLASDLTEAMLNESTRLMQPLKELDSILNIEKSPADSLISPSNPLRFTFAHPTIPNVSCTAWVKSGKPCVEFALESGRVVTVDTDILPKIAISYYQQEAARLQTLFSHPAIADALREKGIINMKLELVSGEKESLGVGFDVIGNMDIETAKAEILSLLPVAGPGKIKTLSFDYGSKLKEKFHQQAVLSIPDVQRLDQFVSNVQSVIDRISTPEATIPDEAPRLQPVENATPKVDGGKQRRTLLIKRPSRPVEAPEHSQKENVKSNTPNSGTKSEDSIKAETLPRPK